MKITNSYDSSPVEISIIENQYLQNKQIDLDSGLEIKLGFDWGQIENKHVVFGQVKCGENTLDKRQDYRTQVGADKTTAACKLLPACTSKITSKDIVIDVKVGEDWDIPVSVEGLYSDDNLTEKLPCSVSLDKEKIAMSETSRATEQTFNLTIPEGYKLSDNKLEINEIDITYSNGASYNTELVKFKITEPVEKTFANYNSEDKTVTITTDGLFELYRSYYAICYYVSVALKMCGEIE